MVLWGLAGLGEAQLCSLLCLYSAGESIGANWFMTASSEC